MTHALERNVTNLNDDDLNDEDYTHDGEPEVNSAPLASVQGMTDLDPWTNDLWQTVTLISPDLLKEELTLATSKWASYRFLTPLQATKLFKAAFVAEYRRYHARNVDYREAEALRIGRKLDLAQHSKYNTQLWRARQFADSLGMPYGAYMEFAFGFAEARRRKYAPQPNQLGPSKTNGEAWFGKLREFWTPERKWLALEAEDPLPEYRLSNDAGLAGQAMFRAELLELGRSLAIEPEAFLETHVVTLEQLSPETCDAAFPGWGALKTMREGFEAKKAGIITGHAYSEIDRSTIRPSCYGLPDIDTLAEAPCQSCSQRSGCESKRSDILSRLNEFLGSADPIARRRQAQAAERQRRFRARRKGISLGSPAAPTWQDVIIKALAEQAHRPE